MENMIEVKGITKMFGNKKVLDNLSLEVEANSFHALIGENGSGKTTLIKSILNLFPDVQGLININNVNNLEKESRDSLFYFPTHIKFPSFISLYNFLFGIYKLHEINDEKIHITLVDLLKKLDLWRVMKNNPNRFSSGQKKKVYLLMALIRKPKLLILDEPTANLDPNTRREFYKILDELRIKGTTILVSTHNLAEISGHVTEASFIFNGKVFWNGKIDSSMKLENHYFSLLNKQMEVK